MIASTQRNGQRVAWDTVELGSCFELQNGVNFSAEQRGSGLLVVDVLNMYSDDLYVRTDRLYRVDIKVPDERLLRPGDVLFVRSSVKESGVGWPAIFKGHDEPVTNCGFLIRARQTRPKMEPKFFVHYLRQDHIRAQMISRAGKVAITNINQERLGSLKIPVPPLTEQRRIAEVLDRAEALRAKRRATLAQLDTLTQTLFLHLLADVEVGGYPMMTLGDAVELVTVGHVGPTSEYFCEDGVPFLRTGNIGALEMVKSNLKFITPQFHQRLKKSTLKEGDVLVSRVISDEVRCAIVSGEFDGANCANVIVIRPGSKMSAHYLAHLIRTNRSQRAFLQRQVGSAQSVVNTGVLKSWQIIVPPLSLQLAFAEHVAAVDKLKAAQRASLAELDALFSSLQHRAFRGEL